MAKRKKKYYTVWKGHKTGVFDTWEECKSQISNFEGAQYKSFPTLEAAQTAFKRKYSDYAGKKTAFISQLSKEELLKIGLPNYQFYFCRCRLKW
jgi:ribonuclease HI